MLGGKQRLTQWIFAELAAVLPSEDWRSLQFLDPMCGGGAVALFAKARGFDVIASDAALRGQAVAHALIANPAAELTQGDLVPLFVGTELTRIDPRAPDHLAPDAAAWFAHATRHADELREPNRGLMRLLVSKLFLSRFPMSQPAATDAGAAARGEFDGISSHRLGHYLRKDPRPDPSEAWRVATAINGGVFPGRGRALRGDAAPVIRQTTADVVYLDPPYAGTSRYEQAYAVLDRLLGDAPLPPPPGVEDLLAAAEHIPWLVLSYGGPHAELEKLTDQVSAHREVVTARAVPYPHMASVASEQHRRTNLEYLIIARR